MVEKLLPFPEMETERLRLRAFAPGDLMAMHEIMRDPAVSRYMNWHAHETVEDTAAVLGEILENLKTGNAFRWAIERKEDGRFMGLINIKPVFIHDRVNSGYWLGRPYWGQGYMAEALRAVIRLCFEELGVNRVEADHYVENPGSGRVMEKAGMEFEAVLKQYGHGKDGAYHDCKFYCITRDRYLREHPALQSAQK